MDAQTQQKLTLDAQIKMQQTANSLGTAGKVRSSEIKAQFSLIPLAALIEMADRFALGQQTHKEDAWNAFSSQTMLLDNAWLINRIEHGIIHLFLYLYKMKGIIPDDGDNDAAAIMWLGAMLSEAKRAHAAQLKGQLRQGPSDQSGLRQGPNDLHNAGRNG